MPVASASAANPLAPTWLSVPDDPNATAASVWPASTARDEQGAITIGGHSVADLAERFGTPLQVIDEADARGRAERVRSAFETAFGRIGARVRVYYAGKAFLTTTVARWMSAAGLGIDVSSGGELAVAMAAGVPTSTVGVHGNNKSDAELRAAVSAGVGSIVIDSRQEIARIARIAREEGRTQPVRIRVNSGVHASTHEFLATSHEDQKFGLPLADIDDAVAEIRAADSLELLGLHTHIGSQIFDGSGFRESAQRLLEAHARLLEGGPIPELNLGGGFGIAYTTADTPRDIEEIADDLAEFIGGECERLGIETPVFSFEPGRWIIGPAGATIYRVGTTKNVTVQAADGTWADRLYVSVDGGMSDNARPALYEADYSVRLGNRTSDAAPALVRLAGKHCESGDLVVLADYLPGDVEPGDLAVVPATGAYCVSLASNYNWLTRPGVLALRPGEASWLLRPETMDDLLNRDTGVENAATTEDHA